MYMLALSKRCKNEPAVLLPTKNAWRSGGCSWQQFHGNHGDGAAIFGWQLLPKNGDDKRVEEKSFSNIASVFTCGLFHMFWKEWCLFVAWNPEAQVTLRKIMVLDMYLVQHIIYMDMYIYQMLTFSSSNHQFISLPSLPQICQKAHQSRWLSWLSWMITPCTRWCSASAIFSLQTIQLSYCMCLMSYCLWRSVWRPSALKKNLMIFLGCSISTKFGPSQC